MIFFIKKILSSCCPNFTLLMTLLDQLQTLRTQIKNYLFAYQAASNKAEYRDLVRQLLDLEKMIRSAQKEHSDVLSQSLVTSEEVPLVNGMSEAKGTSEVPHVQESTTMVRTVRTLCASVGAGGTNQPADVRLVQELLNGTGRSLVVDGLIGRKTIEAIHTFQKGIFQGWSDGRIDPDETTFQRLQGSGTAASTPPIKSPTPAAPSNGLRGSVGRGGTNQKADVRLVQGLLNKVDGGLTVDGEVGPATFGAIERFQRSIFNGWSDGLIDPGGNTWKALQAGRGSAGEVAVPKGNISGNGTYQKFRLQNGHIASIPNGASGALHLVVLFGGASYANPEWMLSQTPVVYHQKALIYIVPQGTGFAGAKAAYTNFFQKNGLAVGTVSICGFSGGGQDVQFASGRFEVKGLIDPYTLPDWVNRSLGKNVIMEYNANNWGGPYLSTRNALPRLAASVRRQGGSAASVSVIHKGFPMYFLNKFANKIL